MKVSIIGSGNVATVLGRLLKQNNFIINEVGGRNLLSVQKLANELNARPATIHELSKNSDVYIVAVNDDAIEAVSTQLMFNEKIVVHTCGSVSINALKNSAENFGVLYPLQSLRKEISYIPTIPFLIDGNNNYSKDIILKLAQSLSKTVAQAGDAQRMQYHLSAVITSNFSNYLYALTHEYCKTNNIDFSFIVPVIEETTNRLKTFNPAEMQTGPAIRGDVSTIAKHISLLKDFAQLKNIYALISESILASKK